MLGGVLTTQVTSKFSRLHPSPLPDIVSGIFFVMFTVYTARADLFFILNNRWLEIREDTPQTI